MGAIYLAHREAAPSVEMLELNSLQNEKCKPSRLPAHATDAILFYLPMLPRWTR